MTLLNILSAPPTVVRRFWTSIARRLRPHRPRARPAVAVKLDKHLLDDIGLTEEDVLGVEGRYWREWEKSQRAWNL